MSDCDCDVSNIECVSDFFLDGFRELLSVPKRCPEEGNGDDDVEEKPDADDLIDQVFTVALSTSACTEHLRLMAEALHKKWISEVGFAPIAAKISYRLKDIMTDSDIPFWTILYGLVWNDFKDRLSIRKISHQIFANSAHYAFEFFNLFYDGASDSVFYVLVDCLYEYANELLDDVCTEEEIVMFHTIFVKMGKLLETINKPKLDAVLVCARKRLIEFTTSAACRCALLEVLELHQNKWDPDSIPYKVRKLYRSYDPVKEQKRRRRYEGRLGGKSAVFSADPGARLILPTDPTDTDAELVRMIPNGRDYSSRSGTESMTDDGPTTAEGGMVTHRRNSREKDLNVFH